MSSSTCSFWRCGLGTLEPVRKKTKRRKNSLAIWTTPPGEKDREGRTINQPKVNTDTIFRLLSVVSGYFLREFSIRTFLSQLKFLISYCCMLKEESTMDDSYYHLKRFLNCKIEYVYGIRWFLTLVCRNKCIGRSVCSGTEPHLNKGSSGKRPSSHSGTCPRP